MVFNFNMSRYSVLQFAVAFSLLNLVTAAVHAIKGTNVILHCFDPKGENWNSSSGLRLRIESPTQPKRHCIFLSSGSGVCGKDSHKYKLLPTGNLRIVNVGLQDEGVYRCTFNNNTWSTNLAVYVAPTIDVQKIVDPLRADSGFVEAAWCTASGGKPPASVKWMTDRHMEFNETLPVMTDAGQTPGLSTVRRVLNVQPTRYYNGQSFFCEIKHPAFQKAEVRILTLNVTYPPSSARISPTADKKGLICTSEGNPPPVSTWMMPSISPLPTMTGDTVELISPQDPARNNDTYICVASNGILPDQKAWMTTNEAVVAITSSQNVGAIVGGVIGGLLLLAIIGIVVYYFVLRPSRDKDTRPNQSAKKQSIISSEEDDLSQTMPTDPKTDQLNMGGRNDKSWFDDQTENGHNGFNLFQEVG